MAAHHPLGEGGLDFASRRLNRGTVEFLAAV
jgi:hypothetical protein